MRRVGLASVIISTLMLGTMLLALSSGTVTAASAIIFEETFEGTWPGQWSCQDTNSASGNDYWGATSYRANAGSHSAWCAQVGASSVNSQQNSANHYYDQSMDAKMEIALGDVSGYAQISLSFKYWAKTGTFSLADYMTVRGSFNATSSELWAQPSVDSGGWQSATVGIPSYMTGLIFRFVSDDTVGLGPYEGVYIDDILITGSDSTPPVSSVDALDQYYNGQISVPFTATDQGSGVSFTELYSRKGSTGSFTKYTTVANPSGQWASSPILFVPTAGDGQYQFYTVSVDALGNREGAPAGPDASTTLDTVAPSTIIGVTGTAGDAGWYTSSVEITFVAGDVASGVKETKYRIDSGQWTTYSAGFSLSVEGNHSVSYYSADNIGNDEEIKSAEVAIDLGAPRTACTLSGTMHGDWFNGPVTAHFNSMDNASGCVSISYRVDGAAVWSTLASYHGDVVFDAGEGQHFIEYRAQDAAGNIEAVKDTSFTMDLVSPSLSIGSPSASAILTTNAVTVTWTGSDLGSGLSNFEIRLDGGSFINCAGSTRSWNFNGLADGEHQVTLRCYDNASNMIETKLKFNVDTSVLSPNGPAGPWVLILLVVAIAAIVVGVILYRRKKAKAS